MSYLRCDGQVTYLYYQNGEYPTCDTSWVILEPEQLATDLQPFLLSQIGVMDNEMFTYLAPSCVVILLSSLWLRSLVMSFRLGNGTT